MLQHLKEHRFVYIFYFMFCCVHLLLYKVFHLGYNINSDHIDFTYTHLSQIQKSLHEHTIPFWNPYEFFGYPFLLTGNFSIKAVPFLLFMKPLDASILVGTFSIFFTGITFYCLCHYVLRLSKVASFLASLVWAFNGISVIYANDSTATVCAHWIPLLAIALMFFEKNRALWFSVLTLGVVDQLLSAHLELVEIANLAVIVFVIYMVLQNKMLQSKERYILIFKKLSVFFCSLLVALIILAPWVSEQFNMIKSSARVDQSHGITQCSVGPVNILSLIPQSDELFGIPKGCSAVGYVGFFGLFLLVCFLFFSSNRLKVRPLFWIAVSVLLMVLKIHLGPFNFFSLFKMLPGHSGLRSAEYWMFFVFFFLALVFGVGFETFLSERPDTLAKPGKVLKLIVIVCSLLALKLAIWDIKNWASFSIALLVFWLMILQIIFLLALQKAKSQGQFVILFTIATVVSSYVVDYTMTGEHPQAYASAILESGELKTLESLLPANKDDYRIMCEGRLANGYCQYLASEEYRMVGGYVSLVSARVSDFFNKLLNAEYSWTLQTPVANPIAALDPNLFYLTNVRYWIHQMDSKRNVEHFNFSNFKKIYTAPNLNFEVYEISSYLPRYYFVNSIETVSTADEFSTIQNKLHEDPLWFKTAAYILSDKSLPPPLNAAAPSVISSAVFKNSEFTFSTYSDQNQYFVLDENLTPQNWKAFVDGVETKLLRANFAFTAIEVPAGKHELQFRYSIPNYLWKLCLVGLFAWVFFLVLGVKNCYAKKTTV